MAACLTLVPVTAGLLDSLLTSDQTFPSKGLTTACVLDAAAHGLGGKRASQCCLALQLLDASAVARRIRQAGAYRKFLGIELKAVSIPGGPDLRPVLAFYCRTTTAEPREQFRKAALSNSIG